MDTFDIVTPTHADGRRTALSLRAMGLRAVIAPDGLRLVGRASAGPSGPSPRVVGPKYQPRDEFGRFVAYWVLSLEILNDFLDIEEEYELDGCSEGPMDLP